MRNLVAEKGPAGWGHLARTCQAKGFLGQALCAEIAQWSRPRTPEAKDPKYVSLTYRKRYFDSRKQGCAILLAEKAPAGWGGLAPGLAKLRVAPLLRRKNCLVGRAEDGGEL